MLPPGQSLMKAFNTQRQSDVLEADGGFTVSVLSQQIEPEAQYVLWCSHSPLLPPCLVHHRLQRKQTHRVIIKSVSKGTLSFKRFIQRERMTLCKVKMCSNVSVYLEATDTGTLICTANLLTGENSISHEKKDLNGEKKILSFFGCYNTSHDDKEYNLLCVGDALLRNLMCLNTFLCTDQ